jgi:EmrB/QacA subfamily drug resistance transporter
MKAASAFKWSVLVIICFAIFILVIDTTMMNVSISALVADLNTQISSIQTVIAVYALIMASFMLLGGKTGDILGRKKAFLIGVIIYGCGTFTASISWNITVLLIGWALLEGIGAALMLPATTTFLTDSYEGRDRAFAFGMWGGISAAGAAFGPIIGGFLTSFYSWRWAFGLELIVVFIILIFSYMLVETEPIARWKDLDVLGTFLSIVGLGFIVLGILLFRQPEVWDLVPFIIGFGLVLLGAFYLWEKRRIKEQKLPLTDITLFKNRTYTLGTVVSAIQNIVVAGFLFTIPIFLQSVVRLDAFWTGITVLPMSVAVFMVSVSAAGLSTRIQPKYLVLIGLVIAISGSYILRNAFSIDTSIVDLIPGSVIFGLGLGLLLSQITNITLSSAEKEQESDASSVLNTAKLMGTSLGTALIGVILILVVFAGLVNGIYESGIVPGEDKEEIAAQLHQWFEKIKHGEKPDIPNDLKPEMETLVDSAISLSMRKSFDAISVILFIGFVAALFIPKTKKK